ncbi:unnamed protein product [Symbiodinium necroappetens]|uniref:Uncharacterized protein n=1 Tax=Symbiodinium necroappetens TaxID=1628268 RepID=A0A813ACC1_9DINO|nr:unnamed protein product [Symbiodinium necroappetens]
MLRIVAAGGRASQAPEETQSEVKLLRAELQDQMARQKHELAACRKSIHELSIQRTKSEASISVAQEAASENRLAEKSCQLRWQSEHRMWSEERRRLKAANQRNLQEEVDRFEQCRQRMSQEMMSSRRKLEGEAREARQRQRAAEGKLKRMEEAEEVHLSHAGEVAEARFLQETAAQEAQRLREQLGQAEAEVLAQQMDFRRQVDASARLQDSFRLELVAAASAREAMVRDWHSQKRHLLQAIAADRKAEEEIAEEQAGLAEQAALVAAERALEVQRLQGLCEDGQHDVQKLREDVAMLEDAERTLIGELSWQKEMREEDIARLHTACEKSLEGLPLEFYQELCSQESGDLRKVPMTVTRYGHMLEAVGGCVKTLLRENAELQEARRSSLASSPLMQSSDSGVSLTHLALTPLSSCALGRDSNSDRNRSSTASAARPREHHRDAPELTRQVFAAHQELAQSREEMRQFMVQRDLEREMSARRSSLEMLRTQELSELSDQNQKYLAELQVLREEVRSKQEFDDTKAQVMGPAMLSTAVLAEEELEKVNRTVRISRAGCDATSSLLSTSKSLGEAHVWPVETLSPAPDEITKSRWRRDGSRDASAETCESSVLGKVPSRVWKSRSRDSCGTGQEVEGLVQPMPSTSEGDSDRARMQAAKATTLERAFCCAEQLCERQQYAEALPLLEEVAQYCDGSPEMLGTTRMKMSDVWAYIGVASQAEGLTEKSIASYRKAIREDSALHVCHANLAMLLSFQEEHMEAQHHMSLALAIDPQNHAYANLAMELRNALQAGT